MYLSIIILPLLSGILIGSLGRKLGIYGSKILGCTAITISCILSIIAYYEVAISESPVNIWIIEWINSEYLEISWSVNIDTLSVSLYLPVLIVSCCVHFYSTDYMGADPHVPRFYSYLSLFTFFMLVLVSGDNLLLIFIGWEGVGICSYLLVNFWFKRIQANKAAKKALIMNRIGDWGLTLGMIVIIWVFGNLELSTIFSLAPLINVELLTIISILVLIGAMAKSAQLGLHTWLPDAMEGPTPVSALIHAATMVTAGVYLLIRVSPLLEYSPTGLLIITWVGGFTALFAASTAIFQNDLKRVIAYSTCSQLGYMVMAVGLSQYTLSVFHLVNHAYFKALLFLSAGAVIHALADEQDMRKYGGLINIIPFTYVSILIGSLSLLAIPYLTGFYSKDLILEVAYGQYKLNGMVAYWLGTITALITSFYSFRLIYLTFISYPNGVKNNYSHAHEPSLVMTIPLVILGFFSIFHGYIAYDLFIGVGSGIWGNSIYINPDNLTTIEGEFGLPLYIKLLPFIGSVSVMIIGYIIYNRDDREIADTGIRKTIYRFLNKKYHIDNIYNTYFLTNILNMGYVTGKRLDKGVLELMGVTNVVNKVNSTSNILARFDNGYIPNIAINIIIGLILIMGLGELMKGDEIILILMVSMIILNKNTNKSNCPT
uniref:NADH dehydrogenase subunit 5 n=1 Tax=Conidiobolus polyspermus TaxID=2074866 RepID=UPI001D1018B0|nr:NADH dehydrogenase subunit 5 [Conidiobolus polyspermus]QZZ81363.1 NADH dehydrogenase subunit 5 [Conidiobolus polyspermus]